MKIGVKINRQIIATIDDKKTKIRWISSLLLVAKAIIPINIDKNSKLSNNMIIYPQKVNQFYRQANIALAKNENLFF